MTAPAPPNYIVQTIVQIIETGGIMTGSETKRGIIIYSESKQIPIHAEQRAKEIMAEIIDHANTHKVGHTW